MEYVRPERAVYWAKEVLTDPSVIGLRIAVPAWPRAGRSLEFWSEDADLFVPLLGDLAERWDVPELVDIKDGR